MLGQSANPVGGHADEAAGPTASCLVRLRELTRHVSLGFETVQGDVDRPGLDGATGSGLDLAHELGAVGALKAQRRGEDEVLELSEEAPGGQETTPVEGPGGNTTLLG